MDNGASSYRRLLDGDKEAFREIIDLYRLNLIFFVNGLIHNLSDGEDIVEDSFFDLIAHPHRYNFSVSLKTYLFTIARNKSVDYLKRQTRHKAYRLTTARKSRTNMRRLKKTSIKTSATVSCTRRWIS